MARRYSRDNRGRFASAGSGATARGGRLKTAGGKNRETQITKVKSKKTSTVAKPRGLKPGAVTARAKLKTGRSPGASGKGKAPATKLPSASSDQYKYNKAGHLATPQERAKMRGRDRAREKNMALADKQRSGQLRAERKAARRLTLDTAEPGSTLRYSSTHDAAISAQSRRSKRASDNFKAGVELERQKSSLTAKALKMQNQAAERKAQGKKITKTMEGNFQNLRRQIGKIDRSLTTRRKAVDVVAQQGRRLEISTRNRSRY